jgi:hypothetical protein
MADPDPRSWRTVTVAAVGAVAREPALWATALRQARRSVPRRWWRRRPYLPVPSAAYLRFRLETQYGQSGPVAAEDVVTFLRWCRDADR